MITDVAGDAGKSLAWPLRRTLIAGSAVFVAFMMLVAGAFYLASRERDIVVAQWQKRLRVSLADPTAKVSDWLRAGKRALAEVAANETVKIYLSELQAAGFDAGAVPHGETQAAFIASYIGSAGREGPFASARPAAPAGRLTPLATAGLALFDGRKHLVASTPGYRPAPSLLSFFMSGERLGGAGPIVLVVGGRPTLAFFRPIRPLQAGGASIGYVIGARDVDGALAAELSSPLRVDGGRIVLVARGGDRVRYLAASDPRDLPPPTQELSLAGLTGDLEAVASPGRLQRGLDLSGQDALLFAETIDNSPLVVVASVPAKIALAGVNQREQALLTALLLAIVAMIAVVIAFNRHQAGVAAARAAEISRRKEGEVRAREALLKAVVNAHPGALLLIRAGNQVALTSARFAGEAGIDAESLIGKPLASVLPPDWRAPVQALLRRHGDVRPVRQEFRDASGRWYAATAVFLSETIAPSGAALLLIDDITDTVRAREARARVYRGIVAILLEAIDRRDPNAAAHSRRTAALARRIASDLGMAEAEIETVDLAAHLQGAGKLFVPETLLRKADNIDQQERLTIEDAAEHWLSLLAQISIDYPVAQVCRLAHEMATTHRAASARDPVTRAAVIVAVANVFVALTSPRAYRAPRTPDTAMSELTKTLEGIPEDVLEALRKAEHAREFAREGG